MNSERLTVDRRTVVGSLLTGTALGLAGCVGDSDDDTDDPDDTDETQQLDSPTEFPDEEACAVCGMITPEHPDWNAQLVKADGTRVYFCSSGCLLAYYADPEQFDGSNEPVENVWVTDYETGALIDGQDCYYARIEDSDHVDDIMMMNPTPFADRENAESFLDGLNNEFDTGYDHETDIVTFDDFNMALAMMYRGRFFDDDGDDGHDH